MDHAVAGHDVGLDDSGVVDAHAGAIDADGHVLTLNGGRGRQGDHVGGGHAAGYDVVRQHRAQLVGIGQQAFDGARGQLGEGFVSGCEDGERAWALERVDQAGGVEGSGQCGE